MKPRCLYALGLSLSLLAACSNQAEETGDATTQQAPGATTQPELVIPEVQTTAPDGSPLALGTWQINESATGASASFVPTDGGDALLLITCDAASRTLSMAISSTMPGNQTFAIRSGGTAARLDTVADGNTALPRQVAQIAANAPVFSGFVQPGGTIEVGQPGGSILRVPSAPGIRRVFEACA